MHNLTKSGSYGLEIAIKESDGVVRTVEYDSFRVSNEADKYRLYISGFKPGSSGLTDRMTHHSNRPFTTKDRDNDPWGGNCAQEDCGGWWFSSG